MMVNKKRRVWKIGASFVLGFFALFVALVGPWPLDDGSFAGTAYYRQALKDIETSMARHKRTPAPHQLRAGWGQSQLNPPPGTPLTGYGARKGRPSQGTHDELLVTAVAVSDGDDTVLLFGVDLLIIPPGIAQKVRQDVARETPLRADDLFFTASHTHSGPGGLASGWAAEQFMGPYDPKVPTIISQAFVEAALQAYRGLRPARLSLAKIHADDLIRNRTRQGSVDDEISIMLLEQDGGRRCIVFSFSAHATVLSDKNMLFSADYPGYSRRLLEQQSGVTAVFLGGATGSMSCRVPVQAVQALNSAGFPSNDPYARCRAMGEEVARRVTAAIQNSTWVSEAEVASIGTGFEAPPVQLRLISPRWRMSGILIRALGVSTNGWISMVRIGRALFVTISGDLSGEISADWKRWASQKGYDLWCSSFSGEYLGYISPDKYYGEWADTKGQLAYETGLMSWLGPHQEAFFTSLMQRMFQALTD